MGKERLFTRRQVLGTSTSINDPSELYGLSFARKYNVFLPSIER